MKALPLPTWLLVLGLAGLSCGRDGLALTPAPQSADASVMGGSFGTAGRGAAGGEAGAVGGRGGGSPAPDGGGGADGSADDVAPGQFPLAVLPSEVPALPLGKSLRLRPLVMIGQTWRDLSADPTVSWESDDPAVADVAIGSGRVTGRSVGKTLVRAMTPLFGTAAVLLTVTGETVDRIAITPEQITMPLGERVPLTAQAHYSDGAVFNVTEAASWSTTDQRTARVQSSVPPLGELTGVLAGQTAVTAIFADVSGSSAVIVTAAGAAVLAVAPATAIQSVGETARFQAVVRLPSGVTTDVSPLASWSSSNTAVARSVGGGQFRCGSAGTVTASALYQGNTATASLECSTVRPEVLALRISPSGGNAPLFVSARYRLMLEATYTDGSIVAVGSGQARWLSLDPATATLDSDATLTGIAPGDATISATFGGKMASERYTFIAR